MIMANPRKVEMDGHSEFPDVSPKSDAAVREDVSASQAVDPADPNGINAKIRADVRSKIKTKALGVESIAGRAAMFDTATHAPGVDYTAGGLLATRWVNNNEANIHAKRMKNFVRPSEVSSHMKDVAVGNMILMVRPQEAQADHNSQIEALNKGWEAQAKKKTSPKSGQGLGEFEVQPQTAVRG